MNNLLKCIIVKKDNLYKLKCFNRINVQTMIFIIRIENNNFKLTIQKNVPY